MARPELSEVLGQEPAGDQFVDRARALIPSLRARGPEADRLRRIPQETIDDLLDCGLLQMMAPKAFGGSECDLASFFDVGVALAEGDASTSWLFGILATHHWLLAHFPLEAQREVFSGRGYALFPLTASGAGGTARRVPGGVVVNGHWSFATGIDFAEWVGGIAAVEGGEPGETLNVLIAADEVQVVDAWFVAGMRGTGSRDFIAKDVFVPDHRTLPQRDLMRGRTPGAAAHPDFSGLKTPLHIVLLLATAGVTFGLTRRAIEEFIDYTRSRDGYGGIDHKARPSTQIRVARALSRHAAYHDRVRALFARFDAQIAQGEKPTIEQRLECRRDIALGAQECADIVNDIVSAAGARGQSESSVFQQLQRDINTVRTHVILDAEDACEAYGKHMLGVELGPVRL